jgi:hypothetical protein
MGCCALASDPRASWPHCAPICANVRWPETGVRSTSLLSDRRWRQRHEAFYRLSQITREPAAQPLGDPISETRVRGRYHRQNPSKGNKLSLGGPDWGRSA